MSGRISKTTKRKDKFGVVVFRFRGSKAEAQNGSNIISTENPIPKKTITTTAQVNVSPNDVENHTEQPVALDGVLMFAATKLPQIPPIPKSLQKTLDGLRSSTAQKIKRSPNSPSILSELEFDTRTLVSTVKSTVVSVQKSTKTKLNGFVAFRAFYARDISSTEHQRELSTTLANVWAMNPAHQLVWERYATEYNIQTRYESNISFVQWLLGMTRKRHREQPTRIRSLKRSMRVENVYLSANGDVKFQHDVTALGLHDHPDYSPPSRVMETNVNHSSIHHTSFESDGVGNIDPVVYHLDRQNEIDETTSPQPAI